jgi:hypothetical protein
VIKSVLAIALGVLLSLAIGLLVVFGILWPVFEAFLDPRLVQGAGWVTAILVFACAFAFYFGGMIASYRAPGHRRLHGTLVAPATFAISPVLNLAAGQGAFPGVETVGAVVVIGVFLAASAAAAYVGSRRGESLYFYNRQFLRKKRRA